MKKLINSPSNVVREMLEGVVSLNAGLSLLDTENVVVRADIGPAKSRPVALISGGGAGHEPAHAGYVGAVMLTAAVVGEVFTSPSVDSVLATIRACAGPAGALLIIKNYTGDRLNFGLAAELAALEGIPTETVVVADDVALAQIVAKDRRRGIAGTVLVHKIAGAAAATGRSLRQTTEIARAAASRIGTMGVALGSCTVPAAGKPGFSLGENEMELGLGIHGEKGVARVALLEADTLADRLVDHIVRDLDLKAGAHVALLINGLGATPPMELAIVGRRALAALRAGGIFVDRAWSGNFLTAIEMAGVSLSVLRMEGGDEQLLDYPVSAPAWPGSGVIPQILRLTATKPASEEQRMAEVKSPIDPAKIRAIGLSVAGALEASETYLTDLDSRAGDGDLGASMTRGAKAIRALPIEAWNDPATALVSIGSALRRAIAGSSGPFYAVALTRAGRHLAEVGRFEPEDFRDAFAIAANAIGEIGGAKPGDRTMLDALDPALRELQSSNSDILAAEVWREAARAAQRGAEDSAMLFPKFGRASYLGDRAIGAPDGGAAAVAIWMKALAECL